MDYALKLEQPGKAFAEDWTVCESVKGHFTGTCSMHRCRGCASDLAMSCSSLPEEAYQAAESLGVGQQKAGGASQCCGKTARLQDRCHRCSTAAKRRSQGFCTSLLAAGKLA